MSNAAAISAALEEGASALRAHRRALQTRSDTDTLDREASWLLENAPPSIGLPMAAAFLVAAKEPARAAELYEAWLDSAEAPAAWHLANLASAYRKLGDEAGIWRTLTRFHPWDLDYDARFSAARALKKVKSPPVTRTLRVALMCTFTANNLLPSLHVGAATLGIRLEVYLGEMDLLRPEIADPASELYAFAPDVVVLGTCWHDLRDADAASQAADWMQLWQPLLDRTNAQILQHTFDAPPSDPLGHLTARKGRGALAAELNARMAAQAPERVTLVDYAGAVARFGASRWADPRQWFWAKEAVSNAAAPVLVEEYLAVLRPLVGRTRKVLVMDLDHTMWGGVVGEDGVEGISVGPPSVEGEAHQALQRYARALKDRGILLAVCSKNNPEDAKAPFESVDDMVLGLDDFVAFEATWDPKPTRVKAMAEALSLGLDSFVFIDDNPAERALMRQLAPEVLTIPMPPDATGYIDALHRARAFDVLAVSGDDARRTAHYQAEVSRKELSANSTPEEYYRSLEMVATLRPFVAGDFNRIVQLAARSNQFNLTTWRMTPGEVAFLAESDAHFCFTVRMRDRYGEYGLVMVVVAEQVEHELVVRALFMSCRVIARTVEELALVELDREAIRRGCTALRGLYYPTKKNQRLVSGLYERFGFTEASRGDDDATEWLRPVDPESPAENPWIAVERQG